MPRSGEVNLISARGAHLPPATDSFALAAPSLEASVLPFMSSSSFGETWFLAEARFPGVCLWWPGKANSWLAATEAEAGLIPPCPFAWRLAWSATACCWGNRRRRILAGIFTHALLFLHVASPGSAHSDWPSQPARAILYDLGSGCQQLSGGAMSRGQGANSREQGAGSREYSSEKEPCMSRSKEQSYHVVAELVTTRHCLAETLPCHRHTGPEKAIFPEQSHLRGERTPPSRRMVGPGP